MWEVITIYFLFSILGVFIQGFLKGERIYDNEGDAYLSLLIFFVWPIVLMFIGLSLTGYYGGYLKDRFFTKKQSSEEG